MPRANTAYRGKQTVELSASQWGQLGAIEKAAERVWKDEGVDIYRELVGVSRPALREMANAALKTKGGGRPNKHSEKLFRSSRPKEERLMPYGFGCHFPVRATQPY